MADSTIVNQVITEVSTFLTYEMPIIGLLAGAYFITTFLFSVLMGIGRRTFK